MLLALAGVGLDKLQVAMQEAAEELPRQGWPVPAATAMQQVVALASRSGAKAGFAVGELIRWAARCGPNPDTHGMLDRDCWAGTVPQARCMHILEMRSEA